MHTVIPRHAVPTHDLRDRDLAVRRNPKLDAIRGLAVAGVVGYHIWPNTVPGGFLGVDVFFVLSGYLITTALNKDRSQRRGPALLRFWSRRARRILPALLGILVGGAGLASLAGRSGEVRLRPQMLSALTFTNNWYQVRVGNSYFAQFNQPIFQHLWSLAVEEQFYLVWPLLFLILSRRTSRPVAPAILAATLATASAVTMAALYRTGHDPSRLYFGTDTHGFSLLIGATAALVFTRASRRTESFPTRAASLGRDSLALLGAVVVLVGFARMTDTAATTYRGGIVLVDLVAAGMILLVQVNRRTSDGSVLFSPIVWLGQRSYSLYLWHWPVIVVLSSVWTPSSATGQISRNMAILFLSFGLANTSWLLLERPVLERGWTGAARAGREWVAQASPPVAASVLTAIIVVAVLAAHATAVSAQQTSTESAIAAGQKAIVAANAPTAPSPGRRGQESGLATIGTTKTNRPRSAPPGVSGSEITVLGDSVTLASAPALLRTLPGISIHARVGAQLWDASADVAELEARHQLRPYVVIALGTNGDVAPATFARIVADAGRGHRFIFVTAHAPRPWIAAVNAKIRGFATHRPRVALADWDAATPRIKDFSDGIHPGPQGGLVFATVIRSAITHLSGKPDSNGQPAPAERGKN